MFWEAVARLGGGSGGGSGRHPGSLREASERFPGGYREVSGEAPQEASQATFCDVIRLSGRLPGGLWGGSPGGLKQCFTM